MILSASTLEQTRGQLEAGLNKIASVLGPPTWDLRKRGFEVLIAPGVDGSAEGELYIDDGESIQPDSAADIQFKYRDGKLQIQGRFGYRPNVVVEAVTLLGQKDKRRDVGYDAQRQSVTKKVRIELTGPSEVTL